MREGAGSPSGGGRTPVVPGSAGHQVAHPHRKSRRGTSAHGNVSTLGGKNPLSHMFCLN